MPEPGETEALSRRLPALDGLRAMTMVVVLAYHGELPGVKGAFLGISQFFTLSGFLITSILLRSHARHGTLQLRAFWTRRYRRLLPAAWLALGLAVLFGATVATPQQISHLPGGIISALAQVANWYFIVGKQSYVDLFAAPSPVQQFWSLAVEEQLYLVVPVVVFLVLRWTRSNRVLGAVLVAGAGLSTVLMIVLYQSGASLDRLYYGTDTRAAELLVGAALAVLLHVRPLDLSARGRQVMGAAGVVAFAAILWAWSHVALVDPSLWRGGFLVFSLVSAVLIVSILGTHGPMTVIFGWGPLPAVGRITYGLYLFHWPIFLWLTEERTGLDVWPLFAVRLTVTFALAVLSYHLLEMPIRNRSASPVGHRLRWVALPSAAALVVGVLVVGQRDVPSDLAGLGEAVTAAPTVAASDHGPLDVLVVADSGGRATAEQLQRRADSVGDLSVTVAAPFRCAGASAEGSAPCENWPDDWGEAVARTDPDVVVFAVANWPVTQIASLSGSTDLAGQIRWTGSVLGAGLDLLTERGATVVWVPPASADLAAATRARNGPFFQAFDRLLSERRDLRRSSRDGDALVDELTLYRRRDATDLTRVLVVGDSSSRTLGFGLEKWAADGHAVVWSAGVEGCGLANDGTIADSSGREVRIDSRCQEVAAGWQSQVDTFDPDVVVVLSTWFDLTSRRLAEWPSLKAVGDPEFDAYLTDAYVHAYDVLSSRGARVVWMRNPCTSDEPLTLTGGKQFPSNAAISHVNQAVLGSLADRRPDVRFFDLASVLCPDGTYVDSLGGVDHVRPDGIHFSPEGSLWLANTYGQQILDAGLP